MLSWVVDPEVNFADTMNILQKLESPLDRTQFRATPEMFSIIIRVPNHRYTVAFKMTHPFFKQYSCNKYHSFKFTQFEFLITVGDTLGQGYASIALSLQDHLPNAAIINIDRFPYFDYPFRTLNVEISATRRHESIGEIDYGSFVSFDLKTFKRLATRLDNVPLAGVRITNSKVQFFHEGIEIINFTTQRRECVIGGIEEGEEIRCTISLHPTAFFCYFISENIWLFKSYDSPGIILIAPVGTFAHISAYYPHDL